MSTSEDVPGSGAPNDLTLSDAFARLLVPVGLSAIASDPTPCPFPASVGAPPTHSNFG